MTNSIFFKGPEHKQRFIEAMQHIGGKIYNGTFDPEYASAVYILTADLSTWRKAGDYVAHTGIDFESLLEEVDFSGGYQALIKWAGNLSMNSSTLTLLRHFDWTNATSTLPALHCLSGAMASQ